MKRTLALYLLFNSLYVLPSFAKSNCDDYVRKISKDLLLSQINEAHLADLNKILGQCSDSKKSQEIILNYLWLLEKNNKLRSNLFSLVKGIREQNKTPALSKISDEAAVETLHLSIKSEFYDRGFISGSFKFLGWEEITKTQERYLSSLPRISNFKANSFRDTFKKITGMPMTTVGHTEVLSHNSKAFEKRLEMIKNAKETIKFMTWGLYDDSAGKSFSDELIKAIKRNIKVQIITDYQVSQRPGYRNELGRLKSNGAEVIFWKNQLNPFYGMHSKMLLVDDRYCLEGGRNIGDLYLKDNKWSDLDVYHEGEIAEVINPTIFSQLWNDQVTSQGLSFKKLAPILNRELQSGETGTFMSDPQFKKADPASNLTLYAIMNAKNEIDIANAYYINTPGMKNALTSAIKRGVRVRILSNSSKSVDEPIVSLPIQQSLKEMLELGAEIYLKNGETLHTKIFRADDLVWFGSYNLHPRSARYELEKLTVSTDASLVRDLSKVFEESLKSSTQVRTSETLKTPNNPGIDLLFGIIFNQL